MCSTDVFEPRFLSTINQCTILLIIVTVLLLSVQRQLLSVPKINGMFHKLDLFLSAGAWWGSLLS
jgi:hypothetical protein